MPSAFQFGYGRAYGIDLPDLARHVCEVLSPTTVEAATAILLETCAQETRFGTYPDSTPTSAGVGLCQIDPIAFGDIVKRTRPARKELIRHTWGIDLDTLQHRDLAYSPLLAFIFCRLFYMLLSAPIPASRSLRAAYWKKYYNTRLGKGTVQEYMDNTNFLVNI